MHALIIVGYFVGVALVLLVGLFNVASELMLRIEQAPRQTPNENTDQDVLSEA
jgi:hypothetical protein